MPKIQRTRVSSSAIRSIGHDPENDLLDIEFKESGAIYEYDGVSARKARGLMNASSIGRNFNRTIRNNYPYERIGTAHSSRRRKHR